VKLLLLTQGHHLTKFLMKLDDQLPAQDESLLGMEEYDDDFDERPLVNFLELCEDT